MSIIRIILFTVIINLISYAEVQSNADEDFNVEKYNGIWYVLAEMSTFDYTSNKPCKWFNAKIQYNCVGCFKEIYGSMIDGEAPERPLGIGVIKGRKLSVSYPSVDKFGPPSIAIIYDVYTYKNGTELILRDNNNDDYTKLLSRFQTFSEETREIFDAIAAKNAFFAIYVHPAMCVLS